MDETSETLSAEEELAERVGRYLKALKMQGISDGLLESLVIQWQQAYLAARGNYLAQPYSRKARLE